MKWKPRIFILHSEDTGCELDGHDCNIPKTSGKQSFKKGQNDDFLLLGGPAPNTVIPPPWNNSLKPPIISRGKLGANNKSELRCLSPVVPAGQLEAQIDIAPPCATGNSVPRVRLP